MQLEQVISLRKKIHQHPELSGNEKSTSQKIIDFLSAYHPDLIISSLGGYGIAFLFKGNRSKTILFRSELDALPIEELNKNLEYASSVKGVSHKCGHDGHMAVICSLSEYLSINKTNRGDVILLFQPAEETGEGAEKILSDAKFNLKPDYVFALHNLPGFEKSEVILKNGTFAAASKGMIIKLTGRTSHASEPEKGISPAIASANIITKFSSLIQKNKLNDFALITIIHARVGEKAFGTSPGYAEVMATIRAFNNDDMNLITDECIKISNSEAEKHQLKIEIEFTEAFPATVNDDESVGVIKRSAEKLNYKISFIEKPFRWSEDFGHFTAKFKGAYFGFGSGVKQPPLHDSYYDFPDEIIEPASKLLIQIIEEINAGKD